MNIPKTEEELLEELQSSIASIEHAVDAFKQSNISHYLLSASGQARALLVSTNNQSPFLINMAEKYGIALEFFSYPGLTPSKSIRVASVIYTGPTWLSFLSAPELNMIKVNLADWMNLSAYCDSYGNVVSRNKLLKEYVDKSVAHYDVTKGPRVHSLQSVLYVEFDQNLGPPKNLQGYDFINAGALENFILDTCSAAIYLGKKFFRIMELKKNNIPIENDNELFILDNIYSSGMPKQNVIEMQLAD